MMGMNLSKRTQGSNRQRFRRPSRAAAALALLGLLAAAGVTAGPADAFKPTAEFGHVGIVRDGMGGITRLSSDGTKTFRFSQRAVEEVRDATAHVDDLSGELFTPAAHCDNEMLPQCSQRIIDLKNAAIDALTSLTVGRGMRLLSCDDFPLCHPSRRPLDPVAARACRIAR